MLFKVSFILFAVSIIFSISAGKRTPCCAPSQSYTGGFQITTGTIGSDETEPLLTQNSLMLHHDEDMMMARVDGQILIEKMGVTNTNSYSVIIDEKNSKNYNFGHYAGQDYCNVTDITAPQNYTICVPDALNYEDEIIFGSGTEQVRAFSWAGFNPADGFTWSVQTSATDCVPVSINRMKEGPNGMKQYEVIMFSNFNWTKPDSSVFKLPSVCLNYLVNLSHKMNSLVVAIVVIGISIVNADMMPCCMKSNTYSAKMQITTATLKPGSTEPTVTYNVLMMNQDSTRMMSRYDGHIDTYMGYNMSTHANYSVLSNFAMGKEYNFGVNDGNTYCNMKDIDTNMTSKFCVPSSLMFDGSYMFGSGSEGIMVNSWSGMTDDMMMWSMQTSMSDCTPISYNKYGMNSDGSQVAESGLFADVMFDSFNAKDPFMVPAMCMNMDLHLNMFG